MRPFLVSIALCLVAALGSAQEWRLRKNEDGITVHTRPVAGSDFEMFRAHMVVKAKPEAVYAILKNLDKHPGMFPNTDHIKIVKVLNDSSQLQYSITEAPWPVSDRDGIFKMTFYRNRKTGGFSVMSEAAPDFMPEKEDMVRIRTSKSSWKVEPIENGQVRITYEVNTDPGGAIPDWLANYAAVDIPFESFQNLRAKLVP